MAGASIPQKAMMHVPPISYFPLFQNISQSLQNVVQFDLFQKCMSLSAKMSDGFFHSPILAKLKGDVKSEHKMRKKANSPDVCTCTLS